MPHCPNVSFPRLLLLFRRRQQSKSTGLFKIQSNFARGVHQARVPPAALGRSIGKTTRWTLPELYQRVRESRGEFGQGGAGAAAGHARRVADHHRRGHARLPVHSEESRGCLQLQRGQHRRRQRQRAGVPPQQFRRDHRASNEAIGADRLGHSPREDTGQHLLGAPVSHASVPRPPRRTGHGIGRHGEQAGRHGEEGVQQCRVLVR
mmetsp:Transcript_30082/g.63795  ORF Transcript_30082/g.63795 Transcript_30082/m.63795 type:complete len:206 (+) Transcript_30082:1816-2433(+)